LLRDQKVRYMYIEMVSGSKSQELLESLCYNGWFVDEKKFKLIELNDMTKSVFGNYIFVNKLGYASFVNKFVVHN